MNVCDVSVVIPNFNRTSLLARALRSIRHQTLLPFEVIVVDDCSHPDRLAEITSIVDGFKSYLNISLVLNDRNRGANACRNLGLSKARAKYVAFLDSDDFWLPEKLERQMAAVSNSETTERIPILSGTGRYRVNDQAEIIARQIGPLSLDEAKIRNSNFIGTLSSIVVDAAIARQIGGLNESLKACQDWEFFIRLSSLVRYVGVSAPLCIYFDHGGERISHGNKMRLSSHLYVYRNYMKNYENQAQINLRHWYRSIAEELQQHAKTRQANRFYAMYKATSTGQGDRPKRLSMMFWFNVFRIFNAPDIRARRYDGYLRKLTTFQLNAENREDLAKDREIIKKLMEDGQP